MWLPLVVVTLSVASASAAHRETVQSPTLGSVELVVEPDATGAQLKLLGLDGGTLRSGRLDQTLTEEIESATHVLVDLDGDGQEDILRQMVTATIGAGPQAGVEITQNEAYLWKDDTLTASPHTAALQSRSHGYTALSQAESIRFLRASHQAGAPPVLWGPELDEDARRQALILGDEVLVFSFVVEKSGKRLSVVASRDGTRVAYRFGRPEKVELEVQWTIAAAASMHLEQEDNWGFARYFRRELDVRSGSYVYKVFDNTYERESPLNGVGVVVLNTQTGSSTTLQAKAGSQQGDLLELLRVTGLPNTTVLGNDYDDETCPAQARKKSTARST